MQTRPQSRTRRGRHWNRWLLYSLIALPALGAQALEKATAKTTYKVIPLSADSTVDVYINDKGQVAFDTQTNVIRANFYDGHTVHDLGTLGGPYATVAGLNNSGQVAGSSTTDPGGQTYHAYRWSHATGMVDLTPNLQGQSFGDDINNKGEVVGYLNSGFNVTGALWSPNAPQLDIPLSPIALNDAETVVGTGGNSANAVHALMWTRVQGVRDLGATPSEDTTANNINHIGHIVGTSGLRAFLWTPHRGLIDLGSGSALGSTAVKGNDKDVIVGYNRYGPNCPAPHYCHGFIWTRQTGFIEIISSVPSTYNTSARDVNEHGNVVGSVDGHAYLWSRAGGFRDLNTQLAGAPPGLKLLEGVAISDNGEIVAVANTGLVLLVPRCGCSKMAPVVGPLQLVDTPRSNAPLSFSAAFTDADLRDTHMGTWSWGDGSTEPASVKESEGTGSVSGQHVYRSPGIYTASLTITDSSGKATTVRRKMAVHGPGVHVAGEGQFTSPPGSSKLMPKRGGIASFAIVSGAGNDPAAPQRAASIEFNAPGIVLRGVQVDSLSIHDGQLQYTGTGKVNGAAGYHFLLTAIPGTGSTGGKDRIRMRIWHDVPGSKAEVVDYDNSPGNTALGADGSGTVLEEGGISVQSS